MTADELIAEGERLKQIHYEDPEQDLWDNDVREFVRPFGDKTYEILERKISPSAVIMMGDDYQYMQERAECISKVQKLLESLKKRSAQRQSEQSHIIAPSFEQAKQQIKKKNYQ